MLVLFRSKMAFVGHFFPELQFFIFFFIFQHALLLPYSLTIFGTAGARTDSLSDESMKKLEL